MAKDFESGTEADSYRENDMEELLGCTTGELVAVHNITLMNRGCLGGDTEKNRWLMAAVISILTDRGVAADGSKLLKAVAA